MVHERKMPPECLLQQVRILWDDCRLLRVFSGEVSIVLGDQLERSHDWYVVGLDHVAEMC